MNTTASSSSGSTIAATVNLRFILPSLPLPPLTLFLLIGFSFGCFSIHSIIGRSLDNVKDFQRFLKIYFARQSAYNRLWNQGRCRS
jgi:hypothetical protein